jgi:hypothetical protein
MVPCFPRKRNDKLHGGNGKLQTEKKKKKKKEYVLLIFKEREY